MDMDRSQVRAIECAHCDGSVSRYAGRKVEQIVGGHSYGLTERYRARLADMAGELPSRQRIGDQVEIIEAYALSGTLVQEIAADDLSWSQQRNLPMQTLRIAFATLRSAPEPRGAASSSTGAALSVSIPIGGVGLLFMDITDLHHRAAGRHGVLVCGHTQHA